MNLPYLLRLASASAAVFFLLNAVLGAAVWLASPLAIRALERIPPRGAARILFALRMLPCGLALLAVACLCVPSYVWLEPVGMPESVSFGCLAAALACAAVWVASLWRTFRAVARYRQYIRHCRRVCRKVAMRGAPVPVWLLDTDSPSVALAGILRPRLVVSRAVVRALSSHELFAALRHERAHEVARDNLKRLCLLLAPDCLPGMRAFRKLDRAWARFAEWAADDSATGGNRRRSLSLAAALVRVSRMSAGARPPVLATPLLGDGNDLPARVDRLLKGVSDNARECDVPLTRTGALAAAVLLVAILQPQALQAAHRLMEMLID